MIVVSDTSVITSLMQIGRIALLGQLHKQVLIPRAVYRELIRSHPVLPAFIETCEVLDQDMVQRLEIELDLGEAEAIVLAKERHADLLLIDEKLGRRIALREGIKVSGLLALLVEGKRRSLVESVGECVGLLETEAGFRVSEAVKAELLREAGE